MLSIHIIQYIFVRSTPTKEIIYWEELNDNYHSYTRPYRQLSINLIPPQHVVHNKLEDADMSFKIGGNFWINRPLFPAYARSRQNQKGVKLAINSDNLNEAGAVFLDKHITYVELRIIKSWTQQNSPV